MVDLSDLFPDQSYDFRIGLRRGEPAAFFQPRQDRSVLEQRRRAIEENPGACLGLLHGGELLVEEAIECFAAWAVLSQEDRAHLAGEPASFHRLRVLGEKVEPDLLLLAPRLDGRMHLLAQCVCFPSSWFPAEKLGRPMDLIHEPAPGLNHTLGAQIDVFLARIRPGAAWLRSNWGLSASPELNQRPDRKLPRLTPELSLQEVWLRVERQALVSLPKSSGVLFGIRIQSERLSSLVEQSPAAAAGLARAIRTMPEDVARYKGIAVARVHLLSELDRHGVPTQ